MRVGGTGWVPEIPAVESPQERVRGILEESEGEDTAMLLFGAVTSRISPLFEVARHGPGAESTAGIA